MCGIWCRLRKRSSALTVTARSTSGSQTTTTTSATSIACCASYNSSTEPGQSRIVQGSSRKVALATLISVDICRARASAAWSPTELPSRTLPCRPTVPLANSIASSRLVLPDRYGPTRATQRGALGIDSSTKSGQGRRGLAALSLDRIVARPSGGGNRNLESGPHRSRSSSAVTVSEAEPQQGCRPGKGRDPLFSVSGADWWVPAFAGTADLKLFQGVAGALDAGAGVAQLLGRGRVGDAEMRREAKRLAMHDRDALGFEQVAREIFVAVDPHALRRLLTDEAGAGRVDVERPLRPRAMPSRQRVQQIDAKVAPLLE